MLDRTRLPTGEPGKPARVGDGARIGGNAVVCGGIAVGADAVVGAGRPKRSNGTSRDEWRTTCPTTGCGWAAG